MEDEKGSMIYQPIPLKYKRTDCEERYIVIHKYIDYKDETLIDIGCANGYFCFRFLDNGGLMARGVEILQDYINLCNTLANIEGVDFKCTHDLPQENFDVGLYLDTYGSDSDDKYLEYLQSSCFSHVKKLFTSCNNRKGCTNKIYEEKLKRRFKSVEPIYKGFEERIIYKCC